jgi:hypothetical protein
MSLSDILGVLGLLTSLIGIPLTFYFARKGRQRPHLAYATDHTILISPSGDLLDGGLKLLFEGREIASVSRTRIALWSSSGDTVKGVDIVESDPLRIALVDTDKLLQMRVLSLSRKQLGVDLSIDSENPASAILGFDFLDAGDGFMVEVVYEGREPPALRGTIRGATVTNLGKVRLDAVSMDLISIKSTFRRYAVGASKKTLAFMLAFPFIFGAIPVIALMLGSRSEQLVDPKNYDLTTLTGQADFAERVRDIGGGPALDGWFYGFIASLFILGLLMVTSTIWFTTKRVVPSSVLRERLSEVYD